MDLPSTIGDKVASIVQSPASTYTGGAVSATSGIASLLDPHNMIFIIGTFGGLFFAWMTYRSRKMRDDEMKRLAQETAANHQKMTEAVIMYFEKEGANIRKMPNPPEVIGEIHKAIQAESETQQRMMGD